MSSPHLPEEISVSHLLIQLYNHLTTFLQKHNNSDHAQLSLERNTVPSSLSGRGGAKARLRVLVDLIISAFLSFAFCTKRLYDFALKCPKSSFRYGDEADSFAPNAMTNIQLGD